MEKRKVGRPSDPLSWNSYEKYLNEFYGDEYDGDWERVKADFGYLYDKQFSRPEKYSSEKLLWNAYQGRRLGTAKRNRNSIAFYAGYSDWVVSERAKLATQRQY